MPSSFTITPSHGAISRRVDTISCGLPGILCNFPGAPLLSGITQASKPGRTGRLYDVPAGRRLAGGVTPHTLRQALLYPAVFRHRRSQRYARMHDGRSLA
jgi:hypothetical protein